MKTKILLAAVAGALVLPVPMASQADVMSGMDFKISGRVAAGLTRADSDKTGESATWDLGTATDGAVRTDSRITLTADRETDIGTAGFKLERDWDTDGLTDVRHQYIYLGGDWGTLSMGNHDTPVGMGNGYDQSYFFGGGGRINDGDRRDGVGYTYNSGALSFGITLHGEGGDASVGNEPRVSATGTRRVRACVAGVCRTLEGTASNPPTVPGSGTGSITPADVMNANAERAKENARRAEALARDPTLQNSDPLSDYTVSSLGSAIEAALAKAHLTESEATSINAAVDARNAAARQTAAYRQAEETIDTTIIGASYDFGRVKVGASYWKDNTESGHDSTSLMVSGDVGQLSYWVMYEAASDATTATTKDDIDGIGVHLGYALSEADNVWLQYGSRDYDIATKSDYTDVVVGYSHSFGGGATAVVEYHSRDNDDVGGTPNPDPSTLHIGFRVSF